LTCPTRYCSNNAEWVLSAHLKHRTFGFISFYAPPRPFLLKSQSHEQFSVCHELAPRGLSPKGHSHAIILDNFISHWKGGQPSCLAEQVPSDVRPVPVRLSVRGVALPVSLSLCSQADINYIAKKLQKRVNLHLSTICSH
jgi:hypothetical protein